MTTDAKKYFSKMTCLEWMKTIPRDRRAATIKDSGLSARYFEKRCFDHDFEFSPAFKFRAAVGIDKASAGQCDFRDMVDESDLIDWDYVRQMLNHRMRKESSKK